ncbi:uncharacterized protein BDCG_17623 [Blastomyces dermatitidis ER-3]|uniref:Uncharacterized protein n=1 Tax=Ajellomyces dermatitidis (strain ER-3 / ATCC MYA-2586) TaxID=559297 RepID=A0ABX2VZH4_AJEDR|nr:uncharacterized protein BDCG_17623 [Blastomyces dermatitidis ER-3]OAT02542.1 hypothetical protein BDCG_17623 [Blastomyces dermatitidis ER-3]
MLIKRESGVATVIREAEKELDMNKLISRRDNISLQSTVTITAAVREAEEEEEDMTMRAVLLQLSDTVIFIFNLAFLTVMKAAATS